MKTVPARLRKKNKIYSIFTVLGLFLILGISCSPKNDVDEKALLKETINRFNTAFLEADIANLNAMVAEDYLHSNGTSEAIGKEVWLNYMKSRRKALEDGSLVVDQYEMDQLKISLFESSAIATARIQTTSTQKGSRESKNFRVTTFWVKDNGQWKRAGFHDGRIASMAENKDE